MTSAAPRGTDVPLPAREFQGHRAGIVTRTLAGGVDYGVVLLVLGGMWLGWAALGFLLYRSSFSLPAPSLSTVFAVGFVVEVVYLTAAWGTTGRTAGNQLLGLRAVDTLGRRMGWGRATLRAALYTVFPLGLAWTAVSARNRSLQDILVHTCVIYDWSAQPGAARTASPVPADPPA